MKGKRINEHLIWALYNFGAAPLLLSGYRAMALFDSKAADYFRIRKGMFERLEKDRRAAGAEKGPLTLFHVASVGEFLQAMPVMAEIRKRGSLAALSYTSSSVANHMPPEAAADIIAPAPIDTASGARKFLEILRPDLLVFSTYDLWPNLMMEANDHGIPVILVNASLPENSGRLGFPARRFFRMIYKHLFAVGAITEDDADRFSLLGVAEDRVRVTGNCRFDQTLARCRAVVDDDPALAPVPKREMTLIAGSTWPEDHRHLLPAVKRLLEKYPELSAVIAPHEPSEKHVAELDQFFANAGIRTACYSRLQNGPAPDNIRVILVDAVGVLYKIYKRGHIAYVGGSFRQGVHNVMEPAGMGLPVIVGPVHKNSAEALEMIREKAAVATDGAQAMETALAQWIDSPEQREQAGKRALKVVEQNAGATARTVALVEEFLPGKNKK